MPISIQIPSASGPDLLCELEMGQQLFVLGPNGTGKSSLMNRIHHNTPTRIRRVLAHRQIWLEGDSSNLAPQQLAQMEQAMRNAELQATARIRDDYHSQRGNVAIHQLLIAEAARNQTITQAVESGDMKLAAKLAKQPSPLNSISEVLALSNIPINLKADGDRLVASKPGSAPYGISWLSDGEKNAILIGSDVLTAPAGTLFIIDEPERHLHRSITAPLLKELFSRRKDCAFIISTHAIDLVSENPGARALLLRGCQIEGGVANKWMANLIDKPANIDDSVRSEILGGRAKMLFVEGVQESLDSQMYGILFPDISVIPKANCKSVKTAVAGIQASEAHHWVSAFGIVDGDGRGAEDMAALKAKGVFALTQYSIESIYYSLALMQKVAQRQAEVTGSDAVKQVEDARTAGVAALTPHIERLAQRIAAATIRNKVTSVVSSLGKISLADPISISVDTADEYATELARGRQMVSQSDLANLIFRYPVRETPALDAIAKALGLQDRDTYERAVRKLLIDDEEALVETKKLFSELIAEINPQA